MKTRVNSIVGIPGKATALFGALAIIIASCTQVESPFSVQEPDVKSFEDLNINVKYAESYDQTEMTFSRQWPEGITAGFSKVSSDGGELLVDYEKTKHVLAFDEDGYMSMATEFIEGDGEINMPESIYHSLKGDMPANGSDYDPVVRTVLENGALRYFSKSGKLVFEQSLNKDEYWINPEDLDALNNDPDSIDTNQSIKGNLKKLELSGLSFNRIGEYHVGYEREATQEDAELGIAKHQYLMDLRNGNINIYASVLPDGNYYSITKSRFANVNGSSVLTSEEYLHFGEINNSWDVVTRRKMTRQNIQIIKN
ncbi:MAG: hypothetical protein JJ971_07675 [Balneolaceae bacterium]|nr:hypothetical protein [Balneolaceae bacterium]MBO6546886.1 hypothetical protein [Balneolaceae bacterium]MBO6649246.1 hypothetical protein [Balneolaceae bacterium]